MFKEPRTKVAISALGLLFLVGSTVFLNELVRIAPEGETSKWYRRPASQVVQTLRSGSAIVERALASKLAGIKERALASIGRPADPLENFRFGVLEGKYALTMNGDKISEISFIDTPNSEGRPRLIEDRVTFLKKHSQLLGATGTMERVSVNIVGTKIVETYRGPSIKPGTDLLMSLTLDDMERLISLKATQVSSLKIF